LNSKGASLRFQDRDYDDELMALDLIARDT
jgi:hypothetical protein